MNGKQSTGSLEGDQKQPNPDHIEPEREQHEPEHEQHPNQPRHISQQEMQKIMPPPVDPDDPQSP